MPPTLKYDPGDTAKFWENITALPGFPIDDYIPLRQMIFQSDAIYEIPTVLEKMGVSRKNPILFVMDATPMNRCGQELKPTVLRFLHEDGWQIEPVILLPDASGQVHTEMPRIHAIQHRIQPEFGVISLGSGVVTDITKHACFLFEQSSGIHIPYLVIQTANSVSAFTSNMAPVFMDGVKRTLPSRYPDALICDLETLRDAPLEMTLAGVGDMLAAFVSLADWYLAFQLGMDDTYNPLPQALLENLYDVLLAATPDIRTPTPQGMEILAKVIALGGLAMSLAHATTPLSGYEHVISHILDLVNERTGAPLAMHGTQVSLATILASRAYQIFLQQFDPKQINPQQCYPTAEHMQQLIQKTFAVIDPSGSAAAECWSDYKLKLENWQKNQPALIKFIQEWDQIKTKLHQLTRPAEDIERILRAVNAPVQFSQCQPLLDETRVRYAFMSAPLMRKRLTLGDVLIFFRWNRDQLWKQIWEEEPI